MGAKDSQGIWRYSESDAAGAATFSELLDLGFKSVSDKFAATGQVNLGLVAAGGSLGTGWTQLAAPNDVRIVREGKKRTLFGTAVWNTGAAHATILTLGLEDRPALAAEKYVGAGIAFNPGSVYTSPMIHLKITAGVLSVLGGTGNVPSTRVILDGITWMVD